MLAETFWDFNLGHLITIGLGAIAWAISVGVWKSEHEALKTTVHAHKCRLDEIDRTGGLVTERDNKSLHEMVRDHEERIRRLETLSSKIDLIANDTQWMKSHLAKAMRNLADESL